MQEPVNTDTKNYDYINNFAVNKNTGEMLNTVTIIAPSGSRVETPEQRWQNKRGQGIAQSRKLRETANKELGKFFFVHNKTDFNDISPAALTRLIFLNTYLDYKNNQLMLRRDTPMHRKDLIKVLGIPKATMSRFWNEVNPKYIRETDNGLIFTNNDFFIRGYLNKSQKTDNAMYRKFFVTGIRKLYKSTSISNHKHLGYIFQLLPYINIEYNIVCHNPLEQDYTKINPMTLQEFCSFIGYSINNIGRLLCTYKHIRFDGDGAFCKFVNDGIDRNNSEIFINPHVLYGGSDYKKVEVLGIF